MEKNNEACKPASIPPSLAVRHAFTKKYEGSAEPPIEIGAVYFRRSNPPEEDWERDYATAREDGHTMFRHWFTWNAIHVAPGVFDWAGYDKHLALAAKHGIKTIIAEHTYEAPDWLYKKYPHARRELANGSTNCSYMGDSDATGVTHMCFDNPEVLEQAKTFLYELARHYRGNPGLYGYDIWNECSLYDAKSLCYCPATQAAFRLWLKNKYGGDLGKLRRAWRRHSLSGWEDIEMPRRIQPYPDTIDMVNFQNDQAIKWMRMRHDAIRSADEKIIIAAHGNAKTFCDIPACGDDYRAGEFCDIFGFTFWYGNHCHTMLGGDMTRIAAQGKEFWRAEAIGNSDWNGRGGHEAPILEKEEMADPANIRLDAMESFAAGARGFINPRWRALQDGALFDAFGWYNLDGSRSERSEEIKKIAGWANGEGARGLWKAQPVRGQVGLLLLREAQVFCYGMYGSTDYYSLAYQGAYEGFLRAGVQADPIVLEHVGQYGVVYAPFPVSMSDESVRVLTEWVKNGGTLIAEGCMGFFSAEGHAFASQPSRGLAELIGAAPEKTSFAPDMWHHLELSADSGRLGGGIYRQSYKPAGGAVFARYDDGSAAGVENAYGKGRARVIGTMAGYGYKLSPKAEYVKFFAASAAFGGEKPLIRADYNSGVIARLWADGQRVYLWCLNEMPFDQRVYLSMDERKVKFAAAGIVRGGPAAVEGGVLKFEVPGRDAAVYELLG